MTVDHTQPRETDPFTCPALERESELYKLAFPQVDDSVEREVVKVPDVTPLEPYTCRHCGRVDGACIPDDVNGGGCHYEDLNDVTELEIEVHKIVSERMVGFVLWSKPQRGCPRMPQFRFKVSQEIVDQIVSDSDPLEPYLERERKTDGIGLSHFGPLRYRCRSVRYFDGERVQCGKPRGHETNSSHPHGSGEHGSEYKDGDVMHYAWTEDAPRTELPGVERTALLSTCIACVCLVGFLRLLEMTLRRDHR